MVEDFKLDQYVKEADVERVRQQTAMNLIVTERDNLSSQLLRRNHELTGVYDKIKTQVSALLRGEVHYNEKLKTIQSLSQDILQQKYQLAELNIDTASIPQMKSEIIQLQNQVIEAQTRIKALEQELENPINVHRWRKLEGSQPQAYGLLLILHSLQKKLIAKTKEELEKSEAIQVKEKLYLHLKTILAKQAGPEAIQQIGEYQKLLKDKSTQLRQMDTELNMYKAQVDEYKHSIAQLDAGLQSQKQTFLKMYKNKVKEVQLATEKSKILEGKAKEDKQLPELPTISMDDPHFHGGPENEQEYPMSEGEEIRSGDEDI
jgi:hypothetical protein